MRMKGGGVYFFPTLGGRTASSILFMLLTFFNYGLPIQAMLAGVCWWVGNCFHVRNYLLALGGYRGSLNPRAGDGDARIDAVVDFIMERVPVTPLSVQLVNGVLATTLRGLPMGILLSFTFGDFAPLWAGVAMAPCYFVGISYQQWRQQSRTLREGGWSLGEWIWGGVIGSSI